MDEELDNSWITEYKDAEKDYNDFYKEQPSSIKLFFIYVDKSNNISFIRKENYILNNGYISRENLINLIRDNQMLIDSKYKLISLLKYNVTIAPEDIQDLNDMEPTFGNQFLNVETNLDTIKFEDTICILQDLNSLYFIYYPDIKPKRDTKRVFINNNHRKTRRKRA
jgi:hypothetical protein